MSDVGHSVHQVNLGNLDLLMHQAYHWGQAVTATYKIDNIDIQIKTTE